MNGSQFDLTEDVVWDDDFSDEEFGNLPLFPNESGDVPSKAAMVDTIQFAASHFGEGLVAEGGAQRFGGHTLRATGAVYFASCGVDVWRIQALGRWGSEAVRGYLRGAHLTSLASLSAEANLGRSLEAL